MNNFIDKYGNEISILKYRTLVKNGKPEYRDWKTGKVLNVEKIETKLNPIAIKTNTKSR